MLDDFLRNKLLAYIWRWLSWVKAVMEMRLIIFQFTNKKVPSMNSPRNKAKAPSPTCSLVSNISNLPCPLSFKERSWFDLLFTTYLRLFGSFIHQVDSKTYGRTHKIFLMQTIFGSCSHIITCHFLSFTLSSTFNTVRGWFFCVTVIHMQYEIIKNCWKTGVVLNYMCQLC